MSDINDELMELQTRLTFQEDTLQQLNQIVTEQDQVIRDLQLQLKVIAKRFDDFLYLQEQAATNPLDERPPHY
jgi:SlyX protein